MTVRVRERQKPPKPPSPPIQPSSTSQSPYPPSGNLVESFNALALAGNGSPPKHTPEPGFVGGFNPGFPPPVQPYPPSNMQPYPSPPASHTPGNPTGKPPSPGALPRPPAMPMPIPQHAYDQQPQSLTMQYALQPDGPFAPHSPPTRPVSASVLSTSIFNASPAPSTPASTGPSRPPAPAPPKVKPTRPRASSDPPTPTTTSSGKGDTVQCSGTTKKGDRCTRQVKANLASGSDIPDELFCHQHSKEVLTPSGFHARKNGTWVEFKDWIPSHLQADTQVSLRVEMEKSKSDRDEAGYIYTFEIRDLSSPDTIKLKVGRAVNLVKRLDEWGKQCGSKEQIPRGWYPGVADDDGTDGGGLSMLKGRIRPGPKGPWCHRLERLIHLELADLVYTGVYLDPKWPKPDSAPVVNGTSGTPKKQPAALGAQQGKKCPDCGQRHKEIFEFKRIKKGSFKGKEWDSIVKPVIEKWGAFVETYV
ncbi:hypothetical protein HGRIS_011866 [Hohenbuehelia grisea]|uniref:DUF1766-domain-containing protein n=1 Tax=Hohenbuehelia grisea TaxID=104357 RepID=A0ABR3JY53_9AGAR